MANLHNVVSDVKDQVFQNKPIQFEVEQLNQTTWKMYVHLQNHNDSAEVEFLIEPIGQDDRNVFGQVLNRGPFSRKAIAHIMDSIIERM